MLPPPLFPPPLASERSAPSSSRSSSISSGHTTASRGSDHSRGRPYSNFVSDQQSAWHTAYDSEHDGTAQQFDNDSSNHDAALYGFSSTNNNRDAAASGFMVMHAFTQRRSFGSRGTPITWLVDSGTNAHITPHAEALVNAEKSSSCCTFGNRSQSDATSVGDCVLDVRSSDGVKTIVMRDVLHIPDSPFPLFSSILFREQGGTYVDSPEGSYLQKDGVRIPLQVHAATKFNMFTAYSLHQPSDNGIMSFAVRAGQPTRTLQEWHDALGHPHAAAIAELAKQGVLSVRGAIDVSKFNCAICKESKSTALSFQRGTRSPKQPGEMLHTDLSGPHPMDVNGLRYYIVFVDEATRYKHVAGLHSKDEAAAATADCIDMFRRYGITIRTVTGDGAGELGRSHAFMQVLTGKAVNWRTAAPLSPSQNGIAERTIKDVNRTARVITIMGRQRP